jgi:hypothetical protein
VIFPSKHAGQVNGFLYRHQIAIERPDRFGSRMKVFDVRRAESLDFGSGRCPRNK